MIDYNIRLAMFLYFTSCVIVAFVTFWLAMNDIHEMALKRIGVMKV